MKHMNRGCYFIFINIFLFKKKSCIDTTGHDLLDINIMHLFTPNFTLNSVLLATKTNFPLSNKKYKKKLYEIMKSIYPFLNNEIIFLETIL